jgi:hypothetical protein
MEAPVKIGDVASAVGKGLVAGAVGTVALTVFQMIEMKVGKREESTAPADAVGKVLEIQPRNEEGKGRLNQVAHFLYGTVWGVPRALLAAVGLREPAATAVHFGAVWGSALTMPAALDVAPPPTEMEPKELALDAARHAVYAVATGMAFDLLDRRSRKAHILEPAGWRGRVQGVAGRVTSRAAA